MKILTVVGARPQFIKAGGGVQTAAAAGTGGAGAYRAAL